MYCTYSVGLTTVVQYLVLQIAGQTLVFGLIDNNIIM